MEEKAKMADPYAEAVSYAKTLWNEFSKSCQSPQTPESVAEALFDLNYALNPCARAFFRFCAYKRFHKNVAQVMFADLTKQGPEEWEGEPASWLWYLGNDRPGIWIDRRCLVDRVTSETDATRVSTWLLLHETGHMVLQWEKLNLLPPKNVVPANYDQEEQAWWFAGAVIGLALGVTARKTRVGPPGGHDGAWKHLCHNRLAKPEKQKSLGHDGVSKSA